MPVLFDSTTRINPPASFGAGLIPAARTPRQYDEIGNRLPIGQNDEDYAWYQLEMAAREAASWSDWTDAMDDASRVTVANADEMLEELELARLEREWLDSIEWPEANAGRCHRS